MCEALPEVGVPGVEMRVEVHQGQGPVPLGRGAQQRQRDGVVAADGDQVAAPWSSASAPASICTTASSVLKGVQAMSPASTTWASSKGSESWAGL